MLHCVFLERIQLNRTSACNCDRYSFGFQSESSIAVLLGQDGQATFLKTSSA